MRHVPNAACARATAASIPAASAAGTENSSVPVTGERTGWEAWSPALADEARERYAFRQMRVERDKRENDERLAVKAQAKLADLENQTRLTDPEAIERKRAVIEAALARARDRAPKP